MRFVSHVSFFTFMISTILRVLLATDSVVTDNETAWKYSFFVSLPQAHFDTAKHRYCLFWRSAQKQRIPPYNYHALLWRSAQLLLLRSEGRRTPIRPTNTFF